MDHSTSTEEAREAFMRHVFGDMMQLEAKLAETSRQISISVENMRQTKTALSRETERLLIETLAGLDMSAKSICASEHKVATAAAEAAREVLLGENGPVMRLNLLADRLFLREREATKWLRKAMEQSKLGWSIVVSALIIGVFTGAVIAKWL